MNIDRSEIIKNISEELNIPKQEVEKAVVSQFSLIKDMMVNKRKKKIRLPYFGIFQYNERRYKALYDTNPARLHKANIEC